MKFSQNFNITFGCYSKRICVFKFEKLHFLVTLLIFHTLVTVYNLNDSYVLYKNCSTFKKKKVGQYPKGICVFKFENFHLLLTLFSFFFRFHRLQY